MHISKADIDDLKERVDIVELIGGVVPLKRQGRCFVGLCPFISEKSPSFTVNPEARLFNCFGACRGNGYGKTGVLAKSGGDVITFVMKWKGLSFQEAYTYLGGRTPSGAAPAARVRSSTPIRWASSSEAPSPAFELGRAPRTRLYVAAFERWQAELAHNPKAEEYLESRLLTNRALWRRFSLGYSSGSLEDLSGTEASEARKHYLEMGVFYESESGAVRETMRGRVVVPFIAFNQLPVGVYGRSVKDNLLPHHRLTRGPRTGFINGNAARGHKELLFVESPFDAFSLAEMGLFNAVPLCGAALPDDHAELVRRFDVKSIVVGLDSDDPGRDAAPMVAEELRKLGIAVRIVEWPEKDPNDLLVKHGQKKAREIVDALLRAARACDVPAPASPAPSPVSNTCPESPSLARAARSTQEETHATVAVSISPLLTDVAAQEAAPRPDENGGGASVRERNSDVEAEDLEPQSASAPPAPAFSTPPAGPSHDELLSDYLALRYEERWWDLTWLESPSVAQLRARVHLELRPTGETHDAPALLSFLDYLNLVVSRARDSFCRRVLSLLPPDSGLSREALLLSLQSDLLKIAEIGEKRRKLLTDKPDEKPQLTEESRQRAVSYLRTQELLGRLSSDIETLGYVGEESIKVLGYLVAISRKLPEALSMVILSSSGSGKSALAEVLEALTPPEDLLVVTRFTTSSLYWMGKDAVKRKFVSIEERAGSQEADYAIRALQSKRKLSMMAPVKDLSTGKIETKLFTVEGPASFLESTTESRIHHENATRCYEARLDESPEQTRRIQEAQRRARTSEGRRQRARADELAVLHHDVQRVLRMVRVDIPFASAIEFPSVWTRNRRDQPRFLNLIEALAFLHQYQRPLKYDGSEQPSERPLEDLGDEELESVYVEATLDDYAAAVDLAGDLLEETLVELKKPLRDFHDAFKKLSEEKRREHKGKTLRMPGAGGILPPLAHRALEPASPRADRDEPRDVVLGREAPALLARELRERTRLPHHTLKRYLRELEDLEYIAVTRGVRGAAAAYRLVEIEEKPQSRVRGLLSVEDLAKKLSKRRTAA